MKGRALVLLIVCSLSLNLRPVVAQSPQEQSQEDGEVVRITTNLVQIDVTATDKQGRQVKDLRPEEFEVFEDGRKQNITNFSYINLNPVEAASGSPGEAAKSANKKGPSVPPVRLRPEQVRRTIALVVDDYQMAFDNIHFARVALKKFVDEQMQPGDLVAILRTRGGVGAMQQFTTDKRQLYAAIERIRWYPRNAKSQMAFALPSGGQSDTLTDDLAEGREDFEDFREDVFRIGTLGALEYVTRGLMEMPGRKAVVVMSDRLPVTNSRGPDDRVMDMMDRLIELANRASIVYYTVDSRGLPTLNFTAADAPSRRVAGLDTPGLLSSLRSDYFFSQAGMNYLAQRTGGTFFKNNNDLGDGIKRAVEDMKGYYLIAYRPDSETFAATGRRPRFHNLKVKVNRPGVEVRTRSGFLGVADERLLTAAKVAPTRRDQLFHAINSPFSSGSIDLRLTSLFGNDPSAGSFMRSLIRVDARALKFTDEAEGWHQAVIDIMVVTLDAEGKVVDEVNRTETIRAKGKTYERLLSDGLIYFLNVPVKQPGAYQLRLAVRDATTTLTGSANQFIEVPDLKKGRLALSGITLTAGNQGGANGMAGSASAQQKEVTREGAVDEIDVNTVPAIRRLRQGMIMDYGYLIYNAQPDKQTGRPQLQTQTRLFRDGQLVFTGKWTPYEPGNQPDPRRLGAGGRLLLGPELTPGEYVLQVVVTDALGQVKYNTATQWIDFEIVK